MKVLLSIKPEFAFKIFEGIKKYEYRRVIFKHNKVTRIVVYASAPIGKVIGEFEIGGILYDEPQKLWAKTKNHAGVSKKGFFKYFSNKDKGYAIKVKTSKLYDVPLSLDGLMVASPPQSFMYLS